MLGGAFLGATAGVVGVTSLEAVLIPLQEEFDLSVDRLNQLVLAVAAGGLLILFAAGALTDRLGPRRVLLAGGLVTTLGALMVAGATGFGGLVAGRVIGGVGNTAMTVASLAVLNSAVSDDRARARVFGSFAAATGAALLISPQVSSLIADRLGWRWVPALWIAVALGAVLTLWGCALPTGSGRRRELFTPLAAGLALSGACVAALTAAGETVTPGVALIVTVGALVSLMLRWRSLRRASVTPTLDVSVFAAPGAKALMAALLTSVAVPVTFYTNLLLQYRLEVDSLQAVQALIIPQAAGVLGGLVGGWVSVRIGSLRATGHGLALGSVAALTCVGYLTIADPPSAPVIVMLVSGFTLATGSVLGTLTKAILDCAPRAASGAAAAWRQAGWITSMAVGGALTGAAVFSFFSNTWQESLRQAGVSEAVAARVAEAIRGGLPIVELLADPRIEGVAGQQAIERLVGLGSAQVDTFRLVALVAAVTQAISLCCVLVAIRRRAPMGSS